MKRIKYKTGQTSTVSISIFTIIPTNSRKLSLRTRSILIWLTFLVIFTSLKALINYSFLDLENNEIESLNPKTSYQQLDVSKNKLSTLFIANTATFVKAMNNQLTNVTIEDDSQLDTLILSGNKLGDKFLLQLKGLKRLETLKLSNTNLKSLKLDTFADLELLETLRLDQNKISSISHGVFAHQANLTSLDNSYNSLKAIDLHVLGALSALEHIDISGNKILSIKDRTRRQLVELQFHLKSEKLLKNSKHFNQCATTSN